MHVVAIRMGLASKDFANDETLETTFDGLNFFNASHLETFGGKGVCYFVSRQLCVDILTKPFIRNIHIKLEFLLISAAKLQ